MGNLDNHVREYLEINLNRLCRATVDHSVAGYRVDCIQDDMRHMHRRMTEFNFSDFVLNVVRQGTQEE